MRKTWLEAALHGPWGKARQPRIPIRVADIVRIDERAGSIVASAAEVRAALS